MSGETQAIVANGIPLAIVSALYTAVTVALAPTALRERRRMSTLALAFLSLFPFLAALTALLAGFVLVEARPFGDHLWIGLAAIVIAALPPLAVLVQLGRGKQLLDRLARSGEVEARAAFLDRELDSVAAVSSRLARARDPEAVARALLEQVGSMLGVDMSVLVLVDEIDGVASGLLGLAGEQELDWVRSMRLDLRDEPSGVSSAVKKRKPIVVDDAETSRVVNQDLVRRHQAKSIAFVPLLIGRKVTGVVMAAHTRRHRPFLSDEIALLQTVAAEAALALDRVRFASELAEALERERVVARIGRKVRSELDLDAVLQVAVSETGRALEVSRCFIRLGVAGEPMTIGAEWHDDGVLPVGEVAERLPVANLAMRRRETVAIGDISTTPELENEAGGRHVPIDLETRAVLATPIAVFNQTIGIFVLHRPEARPWPDEEIKLAEAVAREVGLALHAARLLRESEVRLDHLSTLIKAAQVVSAELRLETVLQRLVTEVTNLLDADAADCYLHDSDRGVIKCAAVHGLDDRLIGFEAPRDRGLAGIAVRERRSVESHEYGQFADNLPSPAYESFRAALVAPMIVGDEVVGVLGVGTRDPARRFGRADREAIEAFAGLATLAIQHAASFEERERRSRIERGFYLVASALAQPLSLAETVDAVAQAACTALGGTFAAVLMPNGETLSLVGRHELPEEIDGTVSVLPPGLADCGARGLVIAAPDAAADTRLDDEWRSLAPEHFRSLLAIPLDVDGDAKGEAVVFFAHERSFTDDDLALAGHLADAAKGALERGRLFEGERSARRLSQQLARIGTFLATELDPGRVVEEVAAEARDLLGAHAATIRLVDGDELVVAAASGEGAGEHVGTGAPGALGLSGEVAQFRAPLRVPDVRLRRASDPDPLLATFDAYLGVPLTGAEGALLGVLSVYNRGVRSWRDEEVEALGALASSASSALSTAELYQRVAVEKERSETILAHVADGIVAVDRDGKVVLWNEAASRITGVDRDDVLGRDPAEVLMRSLSSPESEDGGTRILAIPRGGEEVWLSLSEAVIRDPAGEVGGRIFAFRDVSAQRLVEQMKSGFVSTVSHQLRAPLTSIYGFAETLLRDDVSFNEEERRTFLQYVASESERLTAIVDTLVNVARLEAGDLQVELAPTDLHAIVTEVVASADAGALNGHEFVLELPDGPLAAQADDEKLRQVLVNLVDNAVKYSPEGGRVVISARPKSDAGTVEVAVTDEGVGIPQAEHELIFSKFYRRADLGMQEGMGAGLGLFIAEGLVSAMGGSMRVSSIEGEGSSFAFELPLARAETAS